MLFAMNGGTRTGFATELFGRWWKSWCEAVGLLTTIPLTARPHSARSTLQGWTFPLIGFLVGGLSFLPGLLMVEIVGDGLMIGIPACLLSVLGVMLLTGGLHDDGLADVCDALLATVGWPLNEETFCRRRAVSQDSRVGVGGVWALIWLILWRVMLLLLLWVLVGPWLTAGIGAVIHAGSRVCAVVVIVSAPLNPDSMATRCSFSRFDILGALICWALPALVILPFSVFLILGPIVIGWGWVTGSVWSRWFGSVGGDAIGATIVTAEVVMLGASWMGFVS